jgi:hypothetical protein
VSISVLNTDAGLSGKTLVTAEGTTTQEGLITFDRDPNAPFAVAAGSAVVPNLDSDKLDGQEGAYYLDLGNATGSIAAARLPGGQYYTIVYNNAVQALAHDTVVSVTFDTEEIDTGSQHSTSVNTDRVIAGASGTYLVIGRVNFAANATGYRQLRLNKNGTAFHINTMTNLGASASTVFEISSIISMTATDYITLSAYQNSGGSLNSGDGATRIIQNELRVIRLT